MMKFNEVKELPEFGKDFKRLQKRFRSLKDDLDVFINRLLMPYHKMEGTKNKHPLIKQMQGLNVKCPSLFKSKAFACKSLKGKGVRTGIRVIYAYYEDKDVIELIEIYYKGDKENEDRNRIKHHCE